MSNPRNDQAALDFLATCEYHPEREGTMRAYRFNKNDRLYHELRVCDECANALYDNRSSTGDPLQTDYTVHHDGIRYCGEMAYPKKGNGK